MDEIVSQENNVVADNSANYLEAIKELKSNTVDKSAYDKLVEENKQLLNSLVNGEQLESQKEPEPVDLDELRESLFNKENTNLEYMEKALLLRSELMKKGERDPFLPCGDRTLPTEADIETAQRVADVIQECIDASDGDSTIFTAELQRRMVDTTIQRRR